MEWVDGRLWREQASMSEYHRNIIKIVTSIRSINDVKERPHDWQLNVMNFHLSIIYVSGYDLLKVTLHRFFLLDSMLNEIFVSREDWLEMKNWHDKISRVICVRDFVWYFYLLYDNKCGDWVLHISCIVMNFTDIIIDMYVYFIQIDNVRKGGVFLPLILIRCCFLYEQWRSFGSRASVQHDQDCDTTKTATY